jgi:hypothetical protein
MRLVANADVTIRGVDQAYYRLHLENMRKAHSALMDLRERRLVYETVLDRYSGRLPTQGPVRHRAPQLPRGALGCRRIGPGRMRQTRLARRLWCGSNEEAGGR